MEYYNEFKLTMETNAKAKEASVTSPPTLSLS